MSNTKLLLIEDEADIRLLYAQILQDAGYQVESYSDGEAAMDSLARTDWSLMLLDIMLPGKDGISILKFLKQNPNLKKGPIVLLTNLNSEEIIKEAFSLGADGYLIKSEITPDKILTETEHYLKGNNNLI